MERACATRRTRAFQDAETGSLGEDERRDVLRAVVSPTASHRKSAKPARSREAGATSASPSMRNRTRRNQRPPPSGATKGSLELGLS